MEQKTLIITYDLAPKLGAQSIQISRLLSKSKLPRILIYGDATPYGNSLNLYKEVSEESSKTIKINPWLRERSFLSKLIGKLLQPLFNIPDKRLWWAFKVYLFLHRTNLLKEENVNTILTFGNPMSSHILGTRLSREYKLQHIAHYSDPWNGSPYDTKKGLIKFLNEKLESYVLKNVNHCIFTNSSVLKFYQQRNLDLKSSVLHHSFDKSAYPININRNGYPQSKYVVRIIGDFYGPRSPDLLLKLINRHMTKNHIVKIEFEFYGQIDIQKFNLMVSNMNLSACVKHYGRVSYTKSLELMCTCDLLLLIDANILPNLFLPSKLIDYIGSGTNLFAITNEGPASYLLEQLGHNYSTFNELETVIPKLIESLSKGVRRNEADIHIINNYEVESISSSFDKLMLMLIDSG